MREAIFSDTELTGFADYHAGLLMFNEASLLTHRLSAGMSYGNFEIGGGVLYTNVGGKGYWGPCVNLGYNIRFGKSYETDNLEE